MHRSERRTILLAGMIAADPFQGGATWAVLQYVLGLRRLGHEVCLVEPIPAEKVRPTGAPLADSDNARYFHEVMAAFGFTESTALLLAGTRETVGLPYGRLRELAGRADVLLNIAGMLGDQDLTARVPVRVYLDLDPAFNQLWHATQGIDMRFGGHTHFVTVGLAIGAPSCPVPTCSRPWITTRPPIVLEHWPAQPASGSGTLTTVANWRGYGSIEHQGIFYGQKAHALRPLVALPALTDQEIALALAIHPSETADLEALHQHGWRLVDPVQAAGTPARYRAFIQASWAELGIAKSGYVAARCGWFSDRSACYLASGRPVIAQDTGFSRYLPTGTGLLAFETLDDVLGAIEAVRHDYRRHARAARALAEAQFDSDLVLARLLAQVGAG